MVMAYSFGVVEDKLQEAEFFLNLFRKSTPISFESSCYFSAFVSAARSVTFVLQFSLNEIPGFKEWYEKAQEKLKADSLAPYFVEIRNNLQKKGINPLNNVPIEHLRQHLSRQLKGQGCSHVLVLPYFESRQPTILTDAVEASTTYFKLLVSLIFDVYLEFRTAVDPRWYYTEENFQAASRTFEDAIGELGFPPAWASATPPGLDGWRALRALQSPCQLNRIFDRYLGKTIADPDDTA